MFRRTRKLLKLGAKSITGAACGAIITPIGSSLFKHGLLSMEIGQTCNGMVLQIFVGYPCEHEEGGGGGPEAFNPRAEEDHRGWSHPPQAEAATDQTIWH